METGFPDHLEKDYKKKDNPWKFEMPMYDERSGKYVNVGSRYGVGKKNPVGHEGEAALHVTALPFGKVDTMKIRSDSKKDPKLDIVE